MSLLHRKGKSETSKLNSKAFSNLMVNLFAVILSFTEAVDNFRFRNLDERRLSLNISSSTKRTLFRRRRLVLIVLNLELRLVLSSLRLELTSLCLETLGL